MMFLSNWVIFLGSMLIPSKSLKFLSSFIPCNLAIGQKNRWRSFLLTMELLVRISVKNQSAEPKEIREFPTQKKEIRMPGWLSVDKVGVEPSLMENGFVKLRNSLKPSLRLPSIHFLLASRCHYTR